MLTEEQLELWNFLAPEDVTVRDGQSLLQRRGPSTLVSGCRNTRSRSGPNRVWSAVSAPKPALPECVTTP
jgi:hypothetical protein